MKYFEQVPDKKSFKQFFYIAILIITCFKNKGKR